MYYRPRKTSTLHYLIFKDPTQPRTRQWTIRWAGGDLTVYTRKAAKELIDYLEAAPCGFTISRYTGATFQAVKTIRLQHGVSRCLRSEYRIPHAQLEKESS